MSSASEVVSVDLAQLGQAIDARSANGDFAGAAAAAKLILLRLPRHLPTYQRLIQLAWTLKQWPEGEDWARRLLQADPGNALAWRSLAQAVAHKGLRSAAWAMWKRAFEADPYDPEIRSGLSGASLTPQVDALVLDGACLASLYLRGERWPHAASAYRALVQADDRRIDFQMNWLLALWQGGMRQDAYRLAHTLSRRHPHLLVAWAALGALGDVNDHTLARSPLASMDPDGEYLATRFRLPVERQAATIRLSSKEAELVEG
jgi:tetratricopeptide (TPR) repeat protein